jgi:excisionase family DNA binding protein
MIFLTSKQAAAELGVSDSRIRQLLLAKQLRGERVGRDWMIKPDDLKSFKRPAMGRPRKEGGRDGK